MRALDPFKGSLSEGTAILGKTRKRRDSDDEIGPLEWRDDDEEDEEALIEKRRKEREALLKKLAQGKSAAPVKRKASPGSVSTPSAGSDDESELLEEAKKVLRRSESETREDSVPRSSSPFDFAASQRDKLAGVEAKEAFDMFADGDTAVRQDELAAKGILMGAAPGGSENEALADNYDDSEGYYRVRIGELMDGRLFYSTTINYVQLGM